MTMQYGSIKLPVDALNTNQFIWLFAMWRAGRRNTEQVTTIKTTIKHWEKKINLLEQRKREQQQQQQKGQRVGSNCLIVQENTWKFFNRKGWEQVHFREINWRLLNILQKSHQTVENPNCWKFRLHREKKTTSTFFTILILNGSHSTEQLF